MQNIEKINKDLDIIQIDSEKYRIYDNIFQKERILKSFNDHGELRLPVLGLFEGKYYIIDGLKIYKNLKEQEGDYFYAIVKEFYNYEEMVCLRIALNMNWFGCENKVIIAKDIILDSNLSEETILKYLPWNKNIISDLEKDLKTDWIHKIIEGFSSHKDKLF